MPECSIADGSSFGVFIVKADHSHPPQELLREDWTMGEEVMVERYIPGRELTCGRMLTGSYVVANWMRRHSRDRETPAEAAGRQLTPLNCCGTQNRP